MIGLRLYFPLCKKCNAPARQISGGELFFFLLKNEEPRQYGVKLPCIFNLHTEVLVAIQIILVICRVFLFCAHNESSFHHLPHGTAQHIAWKFRAGFLGFRFCSIRITYKIQKDEFLSTNCGESIIVNQVPSGFMSKHLFAIVMEALTGSLYGLTQKQDMRCIISRCSLRHFGKSSHDYWEQTENRVFWVVHHVLYAFGEFAEDIGSPSQGTSSVDQVRLSIEAVNTILNRLR